MAKNKIKVTIKKIKKRNGMVVAFSPIKIERAIRAGFKAAGDTNLDHVRNVYEQVVAEMEKRFNGTIVPEVEQVQDLIERTMQEKGYDEPYRAFTLYRELHAKQREITSLVDSDELIEKYLSQQDWRVKENANMTYSLQGLNNHVASIISANYWMNKIYPREVRKAHSNGDIHIHDLASLSPYCTGWDLRDFLIRGFGGVSGKVNSKPPKHLRTALGQLVNFLYTIQGEVAGAVAVANFDTYMAPFIAFDKLDYEQTKQCLQEFMFNMNVPTRVGFQTPFSNVSMDLIPTKMVGEEAVIIGGKPQKARYADFQKEIDLFNRAFAEVMMEGDAQGRVFTFPIPTYSITKDFDWDNPNLEPMWEMTRKYGVPYFSNFINSDMDPDDARSMCPLAGEEKVLIKSRRGRSLEYSEIRNIFEGNSKGDEYEIYAGGRFVRGRFNRFRDQRMLKVTLANGHEIKMSAEHLNYVLSGDGPKTVKGEELDETMYLPYSLTRFEGEGGVYDMGFIVGAFAGDGSFDGETTVVFSLENNFKKSLALKLEELAVSYFGAHVIKVQSAKTKLFSLKVHSRGMVGLCRDFVEGKERSKRYRARLFGMSLDFRKGVVDGHYATDGGNRHRIYTSSEHMVETLNMLAATMGTTSCVYEDKRKGRLGVEPSYSVLIYQLNRKKYGDFWKKADGNLWVKIKEIERIANTTAYCFEVENDEPMFTVGSTGILTHNCRLRLDNRVLRKRGGLFSANPLTGSVGVVTINLPRIGFLAAREKGIGSEAAKKKFFAVLGELMDVSKESLQIKREEVEQWTVKGLYPYCRFYLSEVHERNKVYWRNHFNTIGINGMNEALLNLLGVGIADAEGKQFALDVMDYMKEKILIYQKETGEMFNLEATPAEGTAFRFAKMDKARWPEIVVANEKEWKERKMPPFYTNSTHLPVNYTDDIFEALDHQDDLQTMYTGGTVLHGFMGESLPDTKSVKLLVRKVAENYKLPYFSVTPTFSICPKHGYLPGECRYCPKCDEEIGYK